MHSITVCHNLILITLSRRAQAIPLFALCAMLCTCGPAFAQQPPDPDAIQLFQQQFLEQEQLQLELEDAASLSPYNRPTAPAVQESAPGTESSQCIEINQILFTGNQVFPDYRIRRLVAPYENRCLTIEEINSILRDITNAYLERAYTTSRAYMIMPQTRLQDGVLELSIIEGRIGGVEGVSPGERVSAFAFLEGEVLNLRAIEQGLDQINRLGSNQASVDIKADPDQQGVSTLLISNQSAGRSLFSLFADTSGNASTGVWRAGLRLTQDDLFGVNDQINLSYTDSLVSNFKRGGSRSASLSFSVPFGYWTFSNNFSWSQYSTSFKMPISGDLFYNHGHSLNNSFSLEYLLWRGQTSKLSAVLGLTWKHNENWMTVYDLNLKNEASSRSFFTLTFELPITLYFPSGMIYLKPGLAQGLGSSGGLNSTQTAIFTTAKLYANASFNLGPLSWSTALDAQWTRQELFSSENFYLGGEPTIRGFRNESIQGDSGFSLRNELNANLGRLLASQNKLLGATTVGLFFDYGKVWPNTSLREPGTLAGAGIKLSVRYGILDTSLTWARVIEKESWMTEHSALYFNLSLSKRF